MNLEFTHFRNNLFPYLKQVPLPLFFHSPQVSILPQLCDALNRGLNRFIASELYKLPEMSENISKPNKPSKIHTEIIEIISSDEEIQNQDVKPIQFKKDNERKNNFEAKEIQEKTDMSKDHLDFEKEQSIKSQPQSSNLAGKTHLIKKQKSNKAHLKLRKHKYSKIQENLDLTETVDLKLSLLSAHELTLKRESLLQRKVWDWEETGKVRKERREIRMLKN